MFTGIVQELGAVRSLRRSNGLIRLTIDAPKTASRVERLESVLVNGVCLSVVAIRQPAMIFEVIRETERLTMLGRLRPGERVHLEPSLSLSDRLGGALLFGHVDGLGIVLKREQRSGETVLWVRVKPSLYRFLVPKGPVAVDGVSLTVGALLRPSTFTIHLIPETLRQTTLGARQRGDWLNVEIDYFAKLVHQFLRRLR